MSPLDDGDVLWRVVLDRPLQDDRVTQSKHEAALGIWADGNILVHIFLLGGLAAPRTRRGHVERVPTSLAASNRPGDVRYFAEWVIYNLRAELAAGLHA